MAVLDTTAPVVELRLTRGVDETIGIELFDEDDAPYDLTGHGCVAAISSAGVETPLAATISGNSIALHVPRTLSVAAVCRWYVDIIYPDTLVYQLLRGPAFVGDA